jgi:hypothetical protein
MSALLQIDGLARGGRLAMPNFRRIAVGACLIATLSLAFPATAQNVKIQTIKVTAHGEAARGDAASHPHVYLMRGLLNIFSLGMDQLAAQIAHNGVDAGVYNHSVAETVVANIAQKYRAGDHGPYILVGHSLGADAVMTMAQQLDLQGVPVALVVPFDGTESYAAPSNVDCVLNVTQRRYAYVLAGAGFHGKLSNYDVSRDTSVDHFTIDKSPRLQAIAMNAILQAAHGQGCRLPSNAPIVARPKEMPKPIAPAKSASPQKSASPAKSTSPVARTGTEG